MLLLIKMDICDRDERSMRMVCKAMLITPEGTPLVTDHKPLPFGPPKVPLSLTALHNNLSNRFSAQLIMSCSHSLEKI